MKKYCTLVIICSCVFTSCDYYLAREYSDHVGLIQKPFWETGDGFEICYDEKIFPYYYGRWPSTFAKGKDVLRKYFYSRYNNYGVSNESGYITVRFIINCEGKSGRFEVLQTGLDFKKKKFNPIISEQLVELTQALEDWKPLEFYGDRYDSFYYLSFKISNGKLEDILP